RSLFNSSSLHDALPISWRPRATTGRRDPALSSCWQGACPSRARPAGPRARVRADQASAAVGTEVPVRKVHAVLRVRAAARLGLVAALGCAACSEPGTSSGGAGGSISLTGGTSGADATGAVGGLAAGAGGQAGGAAGVGGAGGVSFDGPQLLSETGLYAALADGTLNPGVMPYEVQYPLWSDGSDKRRYLQLPAGARIDTASMDNWVLPVGTTAWKEFVRDGVRVETRMLRKQAQGWQFVAY